MTTPVAVLKALPVALAMPKSVTFTSPARDTRMFCGDTSRWMMPSVCPSAPFLSWAWARPRAASATTKAAVGPVTWKRVPPSSAEVTPAMIAVYRPYCGATPEAINESLTAARANAAAILDSMGAKVIGVADSRGAILNPNGLDIECVRAHKRETGLLTDCNETENLTVEELLGVETDLLIPAAVGGQIHGGNVKNVRARIIAEGANTPITNEADCELNDRGVFIIPDILANAGGVVVSYFEWVQGLQRYFWKETEIKEKLDGIMTRAYREVLEISLAKKIDLRTAATVLGVGRVAEAIRVRGLYP